MKYRQEKTCSQKGILLKSKGTYNQLISSLINYDYKEFLGVIIADIEPDRACCIPRNLGCPKFVVFSCA